MELLVISGGRHPYEESTPILGDFLSDAGHHVQVTESSGVLLSDKLSTYDAIVFNTRREQEITLNRNEQSALTQFIGKGGGFICIHISTCRPDDWHEYQDVTGGGWVTGTSTHPPYGQFTVNVNKPSHPCAQGVTDFITNDELYTQIAWKDGNDVFMTAELEGETHPMAWTRNYGNGRVFVCLLGHNGLSFQTPEFQKLILNGVMWSTSRD